MKGESGKQPVETTGLAGKDQHYATNERRRLNFLKHWKEDDSFEDKIKINYKTALYAKKLSLRNKVKKMTVKEFLETKQDIWELKYFSTSDEEDNDSDIENSEEAEDEESEEEEMDSDDS